MAASVYTSPVERAWYYLHRLLCGAVLLFLIAPILVVLPLSFNSVPFFTYPLSALSLRWYQEFFLTARWQGALHNSIFVALSVTLLSTVLGTLAALGLSRPNFPWRTAVMTILISPIVVPVVITAVGVYFFYADVGLLNSFSGLILAHTTLVNSLCCHHRNRCTDGLRPHPHTCSRWSRCAAGHRLLQGHSAAHTSGYDLGLLIRLSYFL
ncbi:ABC-type spermidine/putrescine transport system permease subunit II [Bradyrhizobium sp. LM2.9]